MSLTLAVDNTNRDIKPEPHMLTCAETAKLVRAELAEAFPGVKFSVRSEVYSMGASVRVRWTDGPTERQVDAVTNKFCRSDFDGMTDSTNYRPGLLYKGEFIRTGADYVTGTRAHSAAFLALVAGALGVADKLEPAASYDGGLRLRATAADFGLTPFAGLAQIFGPDAAFRNALCSTSAF